VPNLHLRATVGSAAVRSRRVFVFVLPADGTFQWHLCAREGGEWFTINESRDFTLVGIGPSWISEIKCDLSAVRVCSEHRNLSYTQEDVRRLFDFANRRALSDSR
jgi:hypothetical protein